MYWLEIQNLLQINETYEFDFEEVTHKIHTKIDDKLYGEAKNIYAYLLKLTLR